MRLTCWSRARTLAFHSRPEITREHCRSRWACFELTRTWPSRSKGSLSDLGSVKCTTWCLSQHSLSSSQVPSSRARCRSASLAIRQPWLSFSPSHNWARWLWPISFWPAITSPSRIFLPAAAFSPATRFHFCISRWRFHYGLLARWSCSRWKPSTLSRWICGQGGITPRF